MWLLYLLQVFVVLECVFGADIEEINVNLKEKNFATFLCPTEEDFVLWYNETEELPYLDRILYPTFLSVKITDLTISDSGTYKCEHPFDRKDIKIFKLKVFSKSDNKPDPIIWRVVPEGVIHFENRRPIILPCRTVDYKITKATAYRITADGKRKKLNQAGVVIHRPKSSDSGDYECEAIRPTDGAISIKKFKIIVRVHGGISAWAPWDDCSEECGYGVQVRHRTCTDPAPANGGRGCGESTVDSRRCRQRSCSSPRLSAFGYDMSGGDLKLLCKAKGIPTPTTEWKYNGRRLPSKFVTKDGVTTVPSSNTRSGSYTCTIRNNSGFYSMSIDIDIVKGD